MSTPQTPVEETLAWEAQQRPRAVAAAFAAALCGFAGALLVPIVLGNGPSEKDGFISLPEALEARLQGRPPAGESLIVRQVHYYADNIAILSLGAVLTALGVGLTAWVLLYLYRATYARNPVVGRLPLIATVTALVAYPVGHLVRRISTLVESASFDGTTAQQANDALAGGLTVAGSLIELIGSFALGLAFVLVALNAMRVGLLTRFLGILGIVAGVLAVVQFDVPQLVRTAWLIGTGLLLAGRIGNGLPPAWMSGRAAPWPSQQQLREQREATAGGGAGTPAPAEPAGPERRKRKKRR